MSGSCLVTPAGGSWSTPIWHLPTCALSVDPNYDRTGTSLFSILLSTSLPRQVVTGLRQKQIPHRNNGTEAPKELMKREGQGHRHTILWSVPEKDSASQVSKSRSFLTGLYTRCRRHLAGNIFSLPLVRSL